MLFDSEIDRAIRDGTPLTDSAPWKALEAHHREIGKVLAARIPRSELLTIDGGEHAAIFTHREEIRAAIMTYLREHAPT